MGDLRVRDRPAWRLSRLALSRLGYAAGCLTASVGLGLNFGPGWGLTVGGVACAASFLLLVDVDDGQDEPTGGGESPW